MSPSQHTKDTEQCDKSGTGQGEDPACSNSTNYLNAHGQLIAKPIFTRENRYAIFATENPKKLGSRFLSRVLFKSENHEEGEFFD